MLGLPVAEALRAVWLYSDIPEPPPVDERKQSVEGERRIQTVSGMAP